MKNYPSIGVQIPDTFLPARHINLEKWAVIACDQYTSEPGYWEDVTHFVGNSPSTLHLILPEVYLGKPEEAQKVISINNHMKQYLEDGTLQPQDHTIYVERTVDGKVRRGLMMALDLEKYDFSKGSQSLIRATEGTILDRLPPRMRIRKDAPLELPHILVLIDDPEDVVIGAVEAEKSTLPVVYDFDLMKGSGHLHGRIVSEELESRILDGLQHLASPEVFYPKYDLSPDKGVLLFAVGDGNHSLATAKAIWEELKPVVEMDHPARYALVEIENIHDRGLEFEPIHRVLFDVQGDPITRIREYAGSRAHFERLENPALLRARVRQGSVDCHMIGMITPDAYYLVSIAKPSANLPVGSLQPILDAWLKADSATQIDYVHGDEIVFNLGSQVGNAGFYLPAMQKSDLFRTVILDGALPRKTFSMGEAHEKRFYMEARKIIR